MIRPFGVDTNVKEFLSGEPVFFVITNHGPGDLEVWNVNNMVDYTIMPGEWRADTRNVLKMRCCTPGNFCYGTFEFR